jgi:hypothetical protein
VARGTMAKDLCGSSSSSISSCRSGRLGTPDGPSDTGCGRAGRATVPAAAQRGSGEEVLSGMRLSGGSLRCRLRRQPFPQRRAQDLKVRYSR